MNIIKRALLLTFLPFSLNLASADEMSMKVGIEPAFAPFDFKDGMSDEIKGFDVDIITAIAKEEGYSIEIAVMPFDALLPAVITEQVDVAISGYTITEERAQIVKLEPYYDSGLGVLVRSKFLDSIKSSYDLQGRTICAKTGTTGSYFAESIKNAVVKSYKTEQDVFMGIDKEECEAAIIDKPVIEYYLVTSKTDKQSLLAEKLTFEQYGILTSKNKESLSEKIAEGLKKIKANGTYNSIYRKWFGKDADDK